MEEECDSPLRKVKVDLKAKKSGKILDDDEVDYFESQKRKRNKSGGIIELRDLAENDFLDLIESKN